MYIESLSLQYYRNIEALSLKLQPGINIFYGQNAQGKTNILEAVFFCATGRSHRTRSDKELIQFGKNYSHIQSIIHKDTFHDKINIHLKSNEQKGVAINGLPIKKLGELFGVLNVVIFSPEDLKLVKSNPAERRKFMDIEICQVSGVYYYDLQQYYKILKQRNILLKQAQKDRKIKESIFPWDAQLLHYGKRLIERRNIFMEKIGRIAAQKHSLITEGKERLTVNYTPNISLEHFEQKLARLTDHDVYYGSTSIGPHKDDFDLFINDKDVKAYCSQGQQRSAALALKLSEIDAITQEKNDTPVLLLDDVLSELDFSRQKFLISSLSGMQVIITCTGVSSENIRRHYAGSTLFYVENGKVMER